MAKDSYIPANSDSCSENSISIPSTTAAQKANSSSNASCSANHSSAIQSDIGNFLECNMTLVFLLNVLVILQSLRLTTFQIIFGNLIVILSFHFTQLMIREGNLIYLGCRVTHGLHLWMEVSVFLVCFLEGELD